MNRILHLRNNLFLILILGFLASCSNQTETNFTQETKASPSENTTLEYPMPDSTNETITQTTATVPRVLIVPCSNGYLYNSRGYDLNPSLEQHLKKDTRIELVPFPLAAMNGAGYFGVYDKKHCGDIIAKTDVDFLIMTRFIGGIGLNGISPNDSSAPPPIWGYSTLVLQVDEEHQFNGIAGDDLSVYEAIEAHIAQNASTLVEKIIAAHSTK